jgi:hypothetical protein
MPRTISFTIPDEYNNRKVVHFLRGSARLSVRLIHSLKRVENGITLNGAHIRTVDLLRTGDVLAVCIPDDERLPEPVRSRWISCLRMPMCCASTNRRRWLCTRLTTIRVIRSPTALHII